MKRYKETLKTLGILAAIACAIVLKLYSTGFFAPEQDVGVGADSMTWEGKRYIAVSGAYTEGKSIARDRQSGWDINRVEEDPSHTFVVARSFLDQYLFVAEEYAIPQSGRITAASWNGVYIYDAAFLEALAKIEAESEPSFSYETDYLYAPKEDQYMRQLYVAYENCPVATVWKGYLGKVDGQWALTLRISDREDGSERPHTVSCYAIPQNYWSILEQYWME